MKDNNIIETLIKKVNKYLKALEKDDEYISDYKIDTVLFNREKNEYGIYVSNDGDFGYFTFKDNEFSEFVLIDERDYSVDGCVFSDIEEGYNIEYISDEANSGIWFEMDTYCIEDIYHKTGFEKYLTYCKENGITAEYFNNHLDNPTGVPTPDIYKNKHLFPEEIER